MMRIGDMTARGNSANNFFEWKGNSHTKMSSVCDSTCDVVEGSSMVFKLRFLAAKVKIDDTINNYSCCSTLVEFY